MYQRMTSACLRPQLSSQISHAPLNHTGNVSGSIEQSFNMQNVHIKICQDKICPYQELLCIVLLEVENKKTFWVTIVRNVSPKNNNATGQLEERMADSLKILPLLRAFVALYCSIENRHCTTVVRQFENCCFYERLWYLAALHNCYYVIIVICTTIHIFCLWITGLIGLGSFPGVTEVRIPLG